MRRLGLALGVLALLCPAVASAQVENPKTVYELHATILRLIGLDHEALTYRFNGRDMRLTDVHGNVMKEILA